MRRVTRAEGIVAACVWDFAGGRSPLSVFWDAALALNPHATDESNLAGARKGHLVALFESAGLRKVVEHELVVRRRHGTFADWWEPFEGGVGPAGAYLGGLDDDTKAALRERCRRALPEAPFTLESVAWAARGAA
jgi:hypothetical protein